MCDLKIISNASNSSFDNICINQFCDDCREVVDELYRCPPFCDGCPVEHKILSMFNAYWLSDLAFDAAIAINDEDNPIAIRLGEVYSEQENLLDSLIEEVQKAVCV